MGDTKQCPDCAETVLAEANVCKHCGFRWAPPAESDEPDPDSSDSDAETDLAEQPGCLAGAAQGGDGADNPGCLSIWWSGKSSKSKRNFLIAVSVIVALFIFWGITGESNTDSGGGRTRGGPDRGSWADVMCDVHSTSEDAVFRDGKWYDEDCLDNWSWSGRPD